MTAWNQLVGALVVLGYREQQALNMVHDLLHEEAARIRSEAEDLKKNSPAYDPLIYEGMLKAAAELDPDDPNWSARCTHCYQPWQKDHVCYMGAYDYLKNHKEKVVDDMADAIAIVDARQWGIRKANEDDPVWTVYEKYGEAVWQRLLDMTNKEARKNLNGQGSPVGGVKSNPFDYHPEDEEPEQVFPPKYRWILQGLDSEDNWITWNTADTATARDDWLNAKRKGSPGRKWRSVKETCTYTVDDA